MGIKLHVTRNYYAMSDEVNDLSFWVQCGHVSNCPSILNDPALKGHSPSSVYEYMMFSGFLLLISVFIFTIINL